MIGQEAPARTAAAEIRHLDKKLGTFALSDINLTIPAGYITGFVGPNGAGKTSTIKCLLGMLRPDAGELTVLGQRAGTPTEQIGIVLDSPSLVGDWSVRQVGRAVGGFYSRWDASAYSTWCERFSIPATTKVKQLSRGMGMKLQLAIALSHQARLLVMDEPTSGLDPLARDDLLGILQEYMLDERNAVLFSTHITADLERVADYVAIINDGRILHAEAKDELLSRYALVRGGPGDLTEDARRVILGLRSFETGYEGLVSLDDLGRLPGSVDTSTPSLDDLVIHLSRKVAR